MTTSRFLLTAILACTFYLSSTPTQASFIHFGAQTSVIRMGEAATVVGGSQQRSAQIALGDSRGSSAHAEASLRDGALHAYASTLPVVQPDCDPRSNLRCRWYIGGTAAIWDVLTFSRADLADPTQVKWKFDINGTLKEGWSSPFGRFAYYVGTDPLGWTKLSLLTVAPGARFGGSFAMPEDPDDTLTLYVVAALEAWAYNGSTADFSHTARFNLELPQGVSFTSESGEFLADRNLPPTAPVPEPPPLALMGSGLLAISLLRRQTRAARDKR